MNISKDLAKLFPLTAFVIFIIDTNSISPGRIIEISGLVWEILSYLVSILAIEILIGFLYTLADLFASGKMKDKIRQSSVKF